MNTEEILIHLKANRAAIDKAIAALNGQPERTGTRKLSKAARLRMSRAQRKRWRGLHKVKG